MGNIQIHKSEHNILNLAYNPKTHSFHFIIDNIPDELVTPAKELEILEVATEENVNFMNPSWDLNSAMSEISRTTIFGAAFGLVGIIGETLYKGYHLTFIAQFKDGNKILATTGNKLFEKIKNDMR